MYPDTKRIRAIRNTVRFDAYDDQVLDMLSKITGTQKSTLIRELAMLQAEEMLTDAFLGPDAKPADSLPRAAG